MFEANKIPVAKYDESAMGKPVQAQDWIALCLPFHNYVLLSGGGSVRTSVSVIGIDETWSIDWRDGSLAYGNTIGLQLPEYGNNYLSGGGSVRTATTTFGVDEQWQLKNAAYDAPTQPILYGSYVVLQMPQHNDVLLSGGSSVRTRTTTANIDEVWRILKVK